MISQFKKKTRKLNPMLLNVIVISAILHVVAAVLIGGWIVSTSMAPPEPEFAPPPPTEKMVPKKIEYSVAMAQQQKKSVSSKPKKRIQVKAINNLNTPKINIALPQINTKIGVAGIGKGIGRGSALGGGGLGMGAKAVSLFKVKASGERFLFLVDCTDRTMTDIKGGLKAYNAIRDEITKLINGLPPSIVFNVGFFDKAGPTVQFLFFKQGLQAATPSAKSEFASWVKTINRDADNVGIDNNGNYRLTKKMPRSTMNHSLQITQVAMEQKADAAFIISGSWTDLYENVRRSPDKKELDWLKKERDKAKKAYEKAGWDRAKLREYAKESAQWTRDAQLAYKAYQEKRVKSGGNRQLGTDYYKWAQKNFKDQPEGPEGDAPEKYTPGNYKFFYEKKEVQAYLRSVIDENYGTGASRKKYSMNLIVFMGDDEIKQAMDKDKDQFKEDQRVWKGFARDFKGRFSLLKSKTVAIKG